MRERCGAELAASLVVEVIYVPGLSIAVLEKVADCQADKHSSSSNRFQQGIADRVAVNVTTPQVQEFVRDFIFGEVFDAFYGHAITVANVNATTKSSSS